MPPDTVRTDRTEDAVPKTLQDSEGRTESGARWGLKQSSAWQMLLALALVVVAAVGLCKISGLSDRLRPLPLPTATPTRLATRTPLPTWTPTNTPVPTATATASPTPVPVVMVGAQAVVSGTGTAQLRLRVRPGLKEGLLATLEDGTRLAVLDGPEAVDGYKWWKVRTDDGQEGWVAVDWLVPVAP